MPILIYDRNINKKYTQGSRFNKNQQYLLLSKTQCYEQPFFLSFLLPSSKEYSDEMFNWESLF